MSNEIGYYGNAWMMFMEAHHPELVQQMQRDGTYEDVARSVNRSACDYYSLLFKQYAQQNPPPDESEAYQSWKYTCEYYVNSMVMQEQVLVAVTRA